MTLRPSTSAFDEELPGLLNEIEELLPDGDSHKIIDLLERLMTYKGLDNVDQRIVQNLNDALMLRSLLSPDEYLTDVVRGAVLGGGAFGRVYKGKWKEEHVAVKKFCHVRSPGHIEGLYKKQFKQNVEPFKSFFRELVLWKVVSTFEYVWPLLGFTMWLDRDEAPFAFALVSPLAEGHLRFSYMDWRSLTPKKFANYFQDVASGLQSLHDHGVIHGDIRPENILLDKGHCYLIDFDVSTSLYSSSSFSFMPAFASQGPPEIFDGSVTHFNENTDIFSFGSTMYKVLARRTLDIGRQFDIGDLTRPKCRRGQEWDAIWDLILRCMSRECANRPTALQLVEKLKAI